MSVAYGFGANMVEGVVYSGLFGEKIVKIDGSVYDLVKREETFVPFLVAADMWFCTEEKIKETANLPIEEQLAFYAGYLEFDHFVYILETYENAKFVNSDYQLDKNDRVFQLSNPNILNPYHLGDLVCKDDEEKFALSAKGLIDSSWRVLPKPSEETIEEKSE